MRNKSSPREILGTTRNFAPSLQCLALVGLAQPDLLESRQNLLDVRRAKHSLGFLQQILVDCRAWSHLREPQEWIDPKELKRHITFQKGTS
jgi:hypothetical protein